MKCRVSPGFQKLKSIVFYSISFFRVFQGAAGRNGRFPGNGVRRGAGLIRLKNEYRNMADEKPPQTGGPLPSIQAAGLIHIPELTGFQYS